MSSRLQSLLSTAKDGLSVSERLRRYGYALSNILKELKSVLKEEEIGKDPNTPSFRSLGEVEKMIGYKFSNKSLLQQAFTHSSYHEKCMSYERLEYMGDSVLNLLITKHQFSMYPDVLPGLLTPLRAANVDTEKLARVAVKYSFHKYLLHRMSVLDKRIQKFISVLPEYPLHSHGLIDAPKILADVVESTIGAIYIDCNYSMDTTWEVTKGLLDPIITPDMLETNPVTKLYEMCHKHGLKLRLLDRWTQEGAYEVFVDDQLRGRGSCRAKKEIALNRAANEAYNQIIQSLSAEDSLNNNG